MKKLLSSLLLILLMTQMSYSRTLIFQSENTERNPQVKAEQQVVGVTNTSELNVSAPTISPVATNANSELFFMIEQLQQEVHMLRGMLEEQGNELRLLKQSAKDRYVDLDNRILDITKLLSSTKSGSVAANSTQISPIQSQQILENQPLDVSSQESLAPESPIKTQREPTKAENDAYQKAYQLIKDKKFDDAILALFAYTENYPDSPLSPNVYYWLGEVYLATSKLDQAKTSFLYVKTAYPESQKIPDTIYKLAVTLDALGDKKGAQVLLKEVQSNHPDSTAAKLASAYKITP